MRIVPGSRVRFKDGSGDAIVQRVFPAHEAAHVLRLPNPAADTYTKRRRFIQFKHLEVYDPDSKLYLPVTLT